MNEETKLMITGRLAELARENDVEVLFACESGSRAWGIESPDSDYDVRFIYHRKRDWYLQLHATYRDVIEETDGLLDFSGWDVRKALRLAYKSNPSLLEWLGSPITYVDGGEWARYLRDVMVEFSPRALAHHYVSLAARQKKSYWTDGKDVRLKKYIYAVRPLMAVQWMSENDYGMPPIRFGDLRRGTVTGPVAEAELCDLLALKSVTSEIDGVGRYPALDDYIDWWLIRGHTVADAAPSSDPSLERLNHLFMWSIK